MPNYFYDAFHVDQIYGYGSFALFFKSHGLYLSGYVGSAIKLHFSHYTAGDYFFYVKTWI